MAKEILKVLAYVTREREGQIELLVFDHRGIPEAGTQVPAGTVEEGELLERAVVRELEEESGLSGLILRGPIHSYSWTPPGTEKLHVRYVFHFSGASDMPDSWTIHPRGAGEEAEKLIFDFRWIPLEQAKQLSGEQGRSIGFI